MVISKKEIKPIYWSAGKVYILDQTLLPHRQQYLVCKEFWQVVEAIRQMRLRGAPLIGVAAGFAFALGLSASKARKLSTIEEEVDRIATVIESARPTAFNLFYAVERMRSLLNKEIKRMSRRKKVTQEDIAVLKEKALLTAQKIASEDIQMNMTLSAHGAYLIGKDDGILTLCNTGSLATAGFGTALGVIRRAWEQGKKIRVYVPETRPYLQGSRLTCYELDYLQIPHTLIVDNAAGFLMQRGIINTVIVGADRIARNGDTANKIGTFTLAVLAQHHNIPFYVAAPTTTVDPQIKEGRFIPVEERAQEEIKYFAGVPVAPEKTDVANFSFDITPGKLIQAIITEKGVARYPYSKSLSKWIKKG